MARYNFRSPRLFVAAPLAAGLTVALNATQIHYLATVLRRGAGDSVLVFNGTDGEWNASLTGTGRRNTVLMVEEKTRPQPEVGKLHYLFSPLKRARLDYMVGKAWYVALNPEQPRLPMVDRDEDDDRDSARLFPMARG